MVIVPKFHIFLIHAAKVLPMLKTLYADGCRALVRISDIEIRLVNAKMTSLAMHILEVVYFLNFVQNLLTLETA